MWCVTRNKPLWDKIYCYDLRYRLLSPIYTNIFSIKGLLWCYCCRVLFPGCVLFQTRLLILLFLPGFLSFVFASSQWYQSMNATYLFWAKARHCQFIQVHLFFTSFRAQASTSIDDVWLHQEVWLSWGEPLFTFCLLLDVYACISFCIYICAAGQDETSVTDCYFFKPTPFKADDRCCRLAILWWCLALSLPT